MGFWRFVFSFLYTRNWHSGQMELSRQRLWAFLAVVMVLLIALIFIYLLQRPVLYEAV